MPSSGCPVALGMSSGRWRSVDRMGECFGSTATETRTCARWASALAASGRDAADRTLENVTENVELVTHRCGGVSLPSDAHACQ
jgi:hypothetical protein